ncbi:MAG: hypothetical protein AB7O32_00215 [Vicinamibacterales bacterium]
MPSILEITNASALSLSTALGLVSPAIPAAGDTVYLTKGNQEFTSDCDLSANDLQLFHISPGFSGLFDSVPLTLVSDQASTGKFVHQGNSRVIRLQSAAGPGVIYEIEVAPARASGEFYLNTVDCEYFSARAGTSFILTGADVSKIYSAKGASVIVRAGSAAPAEARAIGGRIVLERDVTDIWCGVDADGTPGVVELNDTSCTPTNVYMNGGRLVLNDCGNITTKVHGYSGTIDMTNLRKKITVAAAEFHRGLVVVQGGNTIEPTYTATPVRRGGGERIVRV